MQQYRQQAIELNEKKLNMKKKSLLNRVQEILDTVQVTRPMYMTCSVPIQGSKSCLCVIATVHPLHIMVSLVACVW